MGKALLRLLKVVSLIVWLGVSVLGSVVFYNLSHVKPNFEKQPITEMVNQQNSSAAYIHFPLVLSYEGYLFDVLITIRISFFDSNNEILGQNETRFILKPGDRIETNITVFVSDIFAIASGSLYIRFGQLIFRYEIISISLEQPLSIQVQG